MYKWYQIAQIITYWSKKVISKNSNLDIDIPTENNDLNNDGDKNKDKDSHYYRIIQINQDTYDNYN